MTTGDRETKMRAPWDRDVFGHCENCESQEYWEDLVPADDDAALFFCTRPACETHRLAGEAETRAAEAERAAARASVEDRTLAALAWAMKIVRR
jgi:hypothetical protein